MAVAEITPHGGFAQEHPPRYFKRFVRNFQKTPGRRTNTPGRIADNYRPWNLYTEPPTNLTWGQCQPRIFTWQQVAVNGNPGDTNNTRVPLQVLLEKREDKRFSASTLE